jgi:hypothetical protein
LNVIDRAGIPIIARKYFDDIAGAYHFSAAWNANKGVVTCRHDFHVVFGAIVTIITRQGNGVVAGINGSPLARYTDYAVVTGTHDLCIILCAWVSVVAALRNGISTCIRKVLVKCIRDANRVF